MTASCSEASRAAREPLGATAVSALRWLVLEVPGRWPRDVSTAEGLPPAARASVVDWLADAPGPRVQFVRRPAGGNPGLRVFTVIAEEERREVRATTIGQPEDLAELDLAAAGDRMEGSLVLVCGHGSRDRCCALRGTGVFAALREGLDEDELWISSHQGGHRFAGNVLVLPEGVQLGRLDPEGAPLVVGRALRGRIDLFHYRGRTCYEPRVQAAEHAVREAAALEGLDDLRLTGVENGVVRFDASGTEWRAAVEETTGPSVPASCGAEPEPQASFRARVL